MHPRLFLSNHYSIILIASPADHQTKMRVFLFFLFFSSAPFLGALAQQCGPQAGGALCPGNLCCSKWGYCGSTDAYCGTDCISGCPPATPPPPPFVPPPPPGGVALIITRELFQQLLLHRGTPPCQGSFYTYDAFIEAANSFPGFGTTGDEQTRKREIAAFLGQTSHETTGGWDTAPDGRYSWGYCWIREREPASDYCVPNNQYPCVPGQKYFGRGPIQLSYNYNYGRAGEALGLNLLSNPDLVATDPVVSFKTAIWFWMTTQAPKPSCHNVMTGNWVPTPADISAGRYPGYGMATNIINGGLECGRGGPDSRVESRIGFYKRYCDILGISYGDNLDCYTMRPYGFLLSVAK